MAKAKTNALKKVGQEIGIPKRVGDEIQGKKPHHKYRDSSPHTLDLRK